MSLLLWDRLWLLTSTTRPLYFRVLLGRRGRVAATRNGRYIRRYCTFSAAYLFHRIANRTKLCVRFSILMVCPIAEFITQIPYRSWTRLVATAVGVGALPRVLVDGIISSGEARILDIAPAVPPLTFHTVYQDRGDNALAER